MLLPIPSPAPGVVINNDTSTASVRYPVFAAITNGQAVKEYVSSSKLYYVPSTGVLNATGFAGAGTGLTGTAASLSIGGNAATATLATAATNLAGGVANNMAYQTGAGATAFITAPSTSGSYLQWTSVGGFAWTPFSGVTSFSAGTTGFTPNVSNTGAITLAGTLGAANGGTGATTLTGYVYGNGSGVMTASATIPNTAISGLGTMSTQNASGVVITGGTINGTSIGASVVSTGAFTTLGGTTINASTQFSGPGTGLTGTAASLSIGGTAALATSLAGGSAYAHPYQSSAGVTAFLAAGTAGGVLTTQGTGSAPTWSSQASLSVGSANNLTSGNSGYVPYQSAANTTAFVAAGTVGQVFISNGTGAPSWTSTLNGISIGATTRASGDFTTLSANTVTSTTPVLSFNASNSIATFGSTTVNSYNQVLIQNKSTSAGASANYVVSNDLGTDSTYYAEFGMNSSVYSSGVPSDFFSINNGIYFSGHDGDITVGSGNGFKTYLAWGTRGQSAHVINASGAIGLSTNLGTTPALSGTTGYGTGGQVLTSQGPSSAPTWTTPTTSAGGSNTQVQYNSSGALAGSANMTFNGTTLTLASDASISGLTVGLGGGSVGGATAVGSQANLSNTTGDPTAIGDRVLKSNTTGTGNTGLGRVALFSNTTGGSNTGLGMYALYSNTTASYSTAVGYQAGYNLIGGNNDAFGAGALQGASGATGTGNAAFGINALNAISSGTNNVAVGRYALGANTTASYNTAVGYQAGYSNTTGVNNTFVGYQAGYNAYGTGNTAFGQGAGSIVTTGSYNTYLGFGANASSGSVSQELVICTTQSSVTGKGSNTGFINPNGGGVYQGNNSTLWSITSDERIKKNITPNADGLSKILQVPVFNFEYRTPEEIDSSLKPTDAIDKQGVQLGTIAQRLEEVLPECVKTESTGVKTVNADPLTWYMINAIKELNAKVDAQATIIETMQAKLKDAGILGF